MPWFKKRDEEEKEAEGKPEELQLSDHLWIKCNSCNEIIYRKVIERNLQVCPKCNYHFQIPARRRIDCVVDPDTFIEYDIEASKKWKDKFPQVRVVPRRMREEEEGRGMYV